VLNHGLFKGLLFQGAGAVLHATGTRDLESLGGLSRQMPSTALTFLVGAVAISGLPPLNGFVGEFVIYVATLRNAGSLPVEGTAAAVATVAVLALVGGLAAACFVNAFGVIFLGQPRTRRASEAHEASPLMTIPMTLSAALCVAIGIAPAWAIRLVAPIAAGLGGGAAAAAEVLEPIEGITRVMIILLILIAALIVIRRLLLKDRIPRAAETWACAYSAVTPRMQYSAASFAEPVLGPFSALLSRRVNFDGLTGYFPEHARYEEHLGDLAGERFIVPTANRFMDFLQGFRAIQHGRVQLYLAYIFFTLMALLALQFSGLLGG
jgi:hydrogenase-4 component B